MSSQYIPSTPSNTLYTAYWKEGDKPFLPIRYKEVKSNLPIFRCFLLCSPQYKHSLENKTQFKTLLDTLLQNNLKGYQLIVEEQTVTLIEATIQATIDDVMVVYFCGRGVQYAQGVILPDVEDETNTAAFWIAWSQWVVATKSHILIIFDFQEIVNDHKTRSPFSLAEAQKTILIQSIAATQHSNYFFNLLLDIIERTGANLRYNELITRLQNRFRSDHVMPLPTLQAFERSVINTWLLSGIIPFQKNQLVYYHDHEAAWVLDAGRLDGVTPSTDFMDTKVLLENNQLVTIAATTDNYSVLQGFDEREVDNSFTGVIVQHALAKVKIAIDDTIPEDLKQSLQNALQTTYHRFIDVVPNSENVSFLVRTHEHTYYVRKKSETHGAAIMPLLSFQQRPEVFVRQLDFIAQWYSILELDNPQDKIPTNSIQIAFEIIEGQELDTDNKTPVFGKTYINSNYIDLTYRDQKSPLFRCSVELLSTEDKTPFYVNFLFLDSTFGITLYNPVHNVLDGQAMKLMLGNNEDNLMNGFIYDEYIKQGVREAQEFLFVIISKEPIHLSMLLQENFNPQEEISKSNYPTRPTKDKFQLPASNWSIRKVPIRIKYDDKSFEEHVQELLKNRQVKVPLDLHKNRWGGKSSKNGFLLTAIVAEKSQQPGFAFYQVNIIITHQQNTIKDGAKTAILLHDSFHQPVQFVTFSENKASISVTAYEDFTVAAILYDGTELELDISELVGLPQKFYAYQPTEAFRNEVAQALKKEILIKEDLQKNRWGGVASKNGWSLRAEVVPQGDTHKVTLILDHETLLHHEVAFLLHDSFEENQVVYARITDGTCRCNFTSYEAFTVGVYIDATTQLELDLNDRQLKFSESFYY